MHLDSLYQSYLISNNVLWLGFIPRNQILKDVNYGIVNFLKLFLENVAVIISFPAFKFKFFNFLNNNIYIIFLKLIRKKNQVEKNKIKLEK